jgi:hypothetical protein
VFSNSHIHRDERNILNENVNKLKCLRNIISCQPVFLSVEVYFHCFLVFSFLKKGILQGSTSYILSIPAYILIPQIS